MLTSGAKLGPYEILSPLGAGGMGEVYRARDTKLGRDVALKVLPAAVSGDAERMARFQREAQVLASLNHPNIASIHGLEEAGGARALVMELVEGPTLAERLSVASVSDQRTPVGTPALQLDEALGIAKQIAEALEAAHEKGIIHRDLKPANIKITPEGTVKVLDFGLAKALDTEDSALNISNSPTLTVAATQAGVILGTAAYMSPEQAKGKKVDRGVDIWSFGCVLYEMLTGRQTFSGETVSDVLAAVIRAEPDWNAFPATAPRSIRKLVTRCLEKDSKRRLQAIGEARIAIEEYLADPAGASALMSAAATALQPLWRRALPWAIAGAVAIIAALALWAPWRASQHASQPPIRLAVTLPSTERLSSDLGGPAVALSPDGSLLAYVARHGESTRLYLRTMEKFEAEPITGTGLVSAPFFSPDGRWVGFFDGNEGKLKKVAVTGGSAVTICDAPGGIAGATWRPDDTMFFALASSEGPLWRVSAAGGKPEQVTVPDAKQGERAHMWPELLPGGQSILFTIQTSSSFDEARVAVLSLKTGQWRTLLEGGSNPRYVPSGHIVFARGGGLLAVPFDLDHLAVTGSAVPILEGVATKLGGGDAQYSVSANGSLVYAPGGSAQTERTLVGVDRRGEAHPVTEVRRAYEDLTLSPDGQRVALTIEGSVWNIWVLDLASGTLSRITFEGDNRDPVWSADGKRLLYNSFREGRYGLFWKLADGSGPEERLTSSEYQLWPNSWSRDGQLLAFTESGNPRTASDIWVLSLQGDRKPQPFLQTQFNEEAAMLSPDGRWLAYDSDESGRSEVYVQPFPGPGGKWQISGGGGQRPVWARDGQELYYRIGDKVMTVEVTAQPTFNAGKPKVLFEGRYLATGLTYAVTPNGQRFIMIKEGEDQAGPTQINVVLNWFEELKRQVPAGK